MRRLRQRMLEEAHNRALKLRTKNGHNNFLSQLLDEVEELKTRLNNLPIIEEDKQMKLEVHQIITDSPILEILLKQFGWAYGMWYVTNGVQEDIKYLRNDGKLFPLMQTTILDLNGGTYFPTQQDAQDALDRYNASNT